MSSISKEEVKRQLASNKFYVNPESSTGSDHQINTTAQNNAIIYLTQELNQNISELKESIGEYREEVKKYEETNSKQTIWFIIITVAMTFLVLLQVFLMLNQLFHWWE